MISQERCSDIVEAYDRQGWHRTATAVDNQSAAWMVDELRARGVSARIETFRFMRIDADPSRVWAGDWEVEGQAMPDGHLPPEGTILTGTLAGSPGPGRIGLVLLDQHGQSPLLDRMRQEPWLAIVAAITGTPTGLTVRNAWHYAEPGGPPIVQVPAAAWGRLNGLKTRGAPINVACGASRSDVTAANVIARIPGVQPSLPPIVVLTPRSGWWHCAGERGGGIAAWLEVAREVNLRPLTRDLVFLATTGHELGFLGIRRYLETNSALARGALLWVHLGANIGAADSQPVVRSSEVALIDGVRAVNEQSLSPAHPLECQVVAQPPGGEALVVAEAGGRYVSIAGKGFPLFHSTEDRWPQAIDAAAIAWDARLVLDLIRRLDSE